MKCDLSASDPVVDAQAHDQRDEAEHDAVDLRDVDRGVGAAGGAVDLRQADRAERQDGGEQRPVDVVVEPSFEHAQFGRRQLAFVGFRAGDPACGRRAVRIREVEPHVLRRRRRRQRPAVLLREDTCRGCDARRAPRSGRACRARGRRRRRSSGCRAARRTRTSRCRAGPCRVSAPRRASLVRDHLRGAGLARDVACRRRGRGRRCRRRSRPSTGRRESPAACPGRCRPATAAAAPAPASSPLPSSTALSRCGVTRVPPLASVAMYTAIDTGVTDTAPGRCRPRSSRPHTTSLAGLSLLPLGGRHQALTSFGRSMPLFTPRPSSVAHLLILSTPSMLPTV